jgi:hypothetical protein
MRQHRDLKPATGGGFKRYGKRHNWTHISFLWELPYTKALHLPHNIDLMHQERNVAESIISTCFDFTDQTKDNIKARRDLAELCDRLHLKVRQNPSRYESRPRALYCLMPKEREEIFQLLVMFRGYFSPDLWKMLAELSYFYRHICAKEISKKLVQRFEKEIVVLVCKMEKVCPIGFMNCMHELENFERNQVWTLVKPPHDVNVIGTKWIFKNKQRGW